MSNEQQLRDVLERSRALGLLGPGGIDDHLLHAEGFVQVAAGATRLLDLGSGGGVPGLVLAVELPDTQIVLLDASERRVAFLRDSIRRLNLQERVSAIAGRAEDLAWNPDLRERFDTVVARSFASPAITAECAAGFASLNAQIHISEPETPVDRWPDDGLGSLGLIRGAVSRFEGSSIQTLIRTAVGLSDVPRAVGVPAKKPRF